jgi:O-antigen ligase
VASPSALLLAAVVLMANDRYLIVPLPFLGIEVPPWKVVFAAFCLKWLGAYTRGRVPVFPLTRGEIALCLFAGLAFVSILNSEQPEASLRITMWLPFNLTLALACANYARTSAGTFHRLLRCQLGAAVLYAAFGLLGFGLYLLGVPDAPGVVEAGARTPGQFFVVRLVSASGDANIFGSYLAWAIPVSLALASSLRATRLWSAAPACLLTAGTLTFSRGLWAAALVVVPGTLVATGWRASRLRRLLPAVLLGGALLFFVSHVELIADILRERIGSAGTMAYSAPESRLRVWIAALSQMSSSPSTMLFGLGQGAFGNWLSYGLLGEDFRGREGALHVHNVFVEALAAGGVLGGGLFAFGVLATLADAIRTTKGLPAGGRGAERIAAAAGLSGVLLAGLAVNELLSPWLWAAIGFAAGVTGIARSGGALGVRRA